MIVGVWYKPHPLLILSYVGVVEKYANGLLQQIVWGRITREPS